MRRVLITSHARGLGDLAERFAVADIELVESASLEESLRAVIDGRVNVVLVDAETNETTALQFTRRLRESARSVPVLVAGASEDRSSWFDWKELAFDFVPSSFEDNRLVTQTRAALKVALDTGSRVAFGPAVNFAKGEDRLIGESPSMQRVLAAIDRAAGSNSSLLISGEPGSGKRLIARTVHQRNARVGGFFVEVDCAADPDQLEGEFKGGRGSAARTKLEQANQGTLFLSHLERLPLPLQDHLEPWANGAAERLSGDRGRPQFRIIGAAEHGSDPAGAGGPRQPYYAALFNQRLEVPPLRQRLGDLPLLVSYFLVQLTGKMQPQTKSLSPVAEQALLRHDWPGNVRELQDVLRRANMLAASDVIQIGDLPSEFLNVVGPHLFEASHGRGTASKGAKDLHDLSHLLFHWARQNAQWRVIPAIERELIVHALAETGGNQVQASKLLGITRATLRKRLKRFNIRREISIRWQAAGG